VNILSVDQNILIWLNGFLVGKNPALDFVVKFLAAYLIYALPIVLIILWFVYPNKRKALFMSVLGGALAWFVITKSIVPHIWFRARPDLAILGAKEILFHRPDYSFPSDHATMLFGLTFGLYVFGWKKAGNWFLVFAILITLCRVAVGVHFPLDVIGGAISGLIGVGIVRVFEKFISKVIFDPLVTLLRKVRLA